MANSKRNKAILDFSQQNSIALNSIDALDKLKNFSGRAKFVETIELALVLGINATKMSVRGSVTLPNSTGKKISVCCFVAEGDASELIKAGAESAGGPEMIEQIVKGEIKCDVLLTTKQDMPKLGKFGRDLGGKGLMPNPKDGTIADDHSGLVNIIAEALKGKVKFRNDKGGIVHAAVGNVELDNAALRDNLKVIINEVKKLKPSKAKGKYFKKVYLSTTMGPSVLVDISEFE